jgi:hypothetical protein
MVEQPLQVAQHARGAIGVAEDAVHEVWAREVELRGVNGGAAMGQQRSGVVAEKLLEARSDEAIKAHGRRRALRAARASTA